MDDEVGAEGLRAAAIVLDVRDAHERTRTIPGALAVDVATWDGPRDADLVVYCATGVRSRRAVELLRQRGFSRVRSLRGGFAAWSSTLSFAQTDRYARHLALSEVGADGQARLLAARVLVVGAGGLGSPAALYLAAAGIGTIGLVDDDRVDASNLQRQVVHSTATLGEAKVESAARALEALNPDVRVVRHPLRLDASNVDLVAGYDVVVDGTDNFATRYVLNDASLRHRTPVVHASVYRFEGQVTTFVPFAGPCYRCLHREQPPPGASPSCADVGVLGVLPGVLGSLQATEALKLVLGIGRTLVGRLLCYDALALRFTELALPRDEHCPACAA